MPDLGSESTPSAVQAQADTDPALDPSWHYCLGLAGHIQRAFPDRLTLSSWRAVLGLDSTSPDPSTLTIEEIAGTYLKPSVAAQARFSSLVQYSPSKWLLEQEMHALDGWRPGDPTYAARAAEPTDDVFRYACDRKLTGLCLSGGGIRSATFNLGILQGLAAQNKLGEIDYLSSISGGGYIHQFLSSWILCENLDKVQEQLKPLPGDSTRTDWPEPIRWLRRYSNYLTPKGGLLAADTWVAVSVWLRNTILNQIVLVAATLFVLLLPHIPVLWNFPHKFDANLQPSPLVTGPLPAAAIIVALFLVALFHMIAALPCTEQAGDPNDVLKHCAPKSSDGAASSKRIGYTSNRVFFGILLPTFLALFLVSPFLYRSVFAGLQPKHTAVFIPHSPEPGIAGLVWQLHHLAKESIEPQKTATGTSCNPSCASDFCCKADTPKPPSDLFVNTRLWFRDFCYPLWSPLNSAGRPPANRWILVAFLSGQGLLIFGLFWGTSRKLPRWYRASFVAAAMAVGVWTALLLLHVARVLLLLSAIAFSFETLIGIAMTFTPILLLCVVFISMDLAIGTIGRCMSDAGREWLARVRALSFLAGFAWLAIVGCSLLGPVVVSKLFHIHWAVFSTAVLGWLGTSISSLLVGKGTSTHGGAEDASGKKSPLDWLTTLGPPIFLVGLMLSLSWLAQFALSLFPDNIALPILLFSTFTLALFLSWRVDINEFSLHAFYRDRIARCYGGASNPDRYPNAFTGLARSDTHLHLCDLLPTKFSNGSSSLWPEGQPPRYQGPFPIFGATLNLTFGADLATQERKAAAFAFTPLYCGYDIGWTEGTSKRIQLNGFVPTNTYAYQDGGPHLATVVAASGAALSPDDGFHSSPAMSFLLTVFNLRLGWWLPNPRNQRSDRDKRVLGATPTFGLPYLLGELFGQVSDDSRYVSISDGGHFENMGLYELVRRRCTTIVICDAEEDPDFVFEGLGMAIRKCRIDFGAEIKFGLSDSEDGTEKSPDAATAEASASTDAPKLAIPHADAKSSKPKLHDIKHVIPGDDGFSKCAYATGQIFYAAQPTVENPTPVPVVGNVLYLKSTLTGKEPADLRNYKRQHPSFPSDSTLDQWFTESQFESYRRLGQFVAEDVEVKAWLAKHLVSAKSTAPTAGSR
jgi:hypothetical protein